MQPRGRVEGGWWYIHGLINRSLRNIVGIIDSWRSISTSIIAAGKKIRVLGRARFEAGEVAALKSVFDKHATSSALSAPSSSQREDKNQIRTKIKFLLRVLSIPSKRWQDMKLEYVLEEAEFSNQEALDWEELLEVCERLAFHLPRSLVHILSRPERGGSYPVVEGSRLSVVIYCLAH